MTRSNSSYLKILKVWKSIFESSRKKVSTESESILMFCSNVMQHGMQWLGCQQQEIDQTQILKNKVSKELLYTDPVTDEQKENPTNGTTGIPLVWEQRNYIQPSYSPAAAASFKIFMLMEKNNH